MPTEPLAPLVWFTGLSGSGKSTLSRAVLAGLLAQGVRAELLDADQTRARLSAGLGFSRQDREENVRRLGFVANLLAKHGVVTLVAAMSPYREGRRPVRVEVFVDAPIGVCEQRDPVGLYRRFRAGLIHSLNGLDEPYEIPESPEIHCRTSLDSIDGSTAQVMKFLTPLLMPRQSE
jgi:adenylylsulfate kinase